MEFIKKYYYLLSGLFVFIIYLTTLAPTVVKIDSGELSAVQTTLGIAHPTGYPLFTIVGYLFSLIPLPFRDIYKLNLLAAIWCTAGTSVFVYTTKFVLDNINSFHITRKEPQQKSKKKKKIKDAKTSIQAFSIPDDKKYIAAIGGGLILAFSRTFWMQSTSVEVYSLHILLVSLIILFLVKGFVEKNSSTKFSRNWILFSFFLALGFTNHMTTLIILPGTAYLFFVKYGFNKPAFKKIGLMLLIFFPVLILVYSYLPIRASQNPLVNWGNPLDLERIIRHISGKQYQVWLFSSTESAKKQLEYFFSTLPIEFSINLFIAFIGVIYSFISARKFGIFILILFITTVLYSINYDINDIDSYFLLAYIAIGFFSVFGIVKLLSFLKIQNSYNIGAALISLFILVHFVITYPKVDESETYIYEDYTKEILGSVSQNAIVFSYQWDYFLSASYYFQLVEKYRKDIVVIDKELLRRSWYYNQLEKNYPGVLDGVKNEKELFLNALKPFEKDEVIDSKLLENLYRRIMTNLLSTNIGKRDFYIGPELFENEMQKGEFILPEGYTLIPDGFLFQVVKNTKEYIPAVSNDFKIRIPERKDKYIENIINMFICPMLVRRAMYEFQFDKIDRAKLYIEKIRKDFPEYKLPKALTDLF
ncbi:MAG: hypothetical protein A2V93_08950 [Ignavibacteria bacterium RBG_16_34_14]|nr:MAG: hypothetical protein A2V93_08950 [Ignavibacteria bacterium RBG_16_34_14]